MLADNMLDLKKLDNEKKRFEPFDNVTAYITSLGFQERLGLGGHGHALESIANSFHSSSSALRLALRGSSSIYAYQHTTAIGTIQSCRLSDVVTRHIEQLPENWNQDMDSRKRYYDFFDMYGTHVVSQVAIGGLVRVIASRRKGDTLRRVASSQGHMPHDITILRDGGASMASLLYSELNKHPWDSPAKIQSLDPATAPGLQAWIAALGRDPVFCEPR
jgi:hypothetical protein